MVGVESQLLATQQCDPTSSRPMVQTVQCTEVQDPNVVSGPHPEQDDSYTLAIGAADNSETCFWSKKDHRDNIDVDESGTDDDKKNIQIIVKKLELAGESEKEEQQKQVKKLQNKCVDVTGSKVNFPDNKTVEECGSIVKNNDKNLEDAEDNKVKDHHEFMPEKHEEETLEKPDKLKEKLLKQRKRRRRRKRSKMANSRKMMADQPKEYIEVPGIVTATGGQKGGVKSSTNNQTNTNSNRRHTGKRHPSGGDAMGGSAGGGGCGGEPPTPPEEWKDRAPCDGHVEAKKRGRRPSKRLITRQDSHTSLPSPIRQGAPYVQKQSPEDHKDQVFSLPPIGILPASDLVIENFVQPAFQHIQYQPSFVHWRTHICQPCKTMQACLNHLRGCNGQLTCDICKKTFDEIDRHVKLCQRSEDDMCGMDLCREFHSAATQGKEAQFEILSRFAASFYDAELNTPKLLQYPVQRQQSVSTDIPMSRKPSLGAAGSVFEPAAPPNMKRDLEEDSPSGDDDDNENEKSGVNQLGVNSNGDVPSYNIGQNEQLSIINGEIGSLQQPSLIENLPGTATITSGAVRPVQQHIPRTKVNKTAVTEHYLDKPYHTRRQLHQDHAAQQEVKAPPMWMREIDEELEPPPIRKKVTYGEKRHLRAFLPVWGKLQEMLKNGSDKPEAVMDDEEEGIIFFKGMVIQNGRYQDGNQYMKVGSPLGTGAFGKVYLCRDQTNGFEFVVKIVPLDRFNPDEALIWSEMDHPNIVRLFGVIRRGESIYFFSDFVANRTLKSLVGNGRVMSQGEALYHMKELLHILKYVHGQKVVHKDLKPENILVTAEGRLLLIDWGLAKIIRRGCLDSNQNPEGTQHYMAPEVARSESYDFGADIWSTMCIGIHLISGYPPWIQKYKDVPYLIFVIGVKSPPLDDIPEDAHAEVKDLLVKGLNVDRLKRPAVMELLEHPAFDLIPELQHVEAVTPSEKFKQQLELENEMSKIADAPSEGEWRPRFAPAEGCTTIDLLSLSDAPFCGLTPEEPKKKIFYPAEGNSTINLPYLSEAPFCVLTPEEPRENILFPGGHGSDSLCDESEHQIEDVSRRSGPALPPELDLQKVESGNPVANQDPVESPAVQLEFAALNLGGVAGASSLASHDLSLSNRTTLQNESNQRKGQSRVRMPVFDFSRLPMVPEQRSLPNMDRAKDQKKVSNKVQQGKKDNKPERDIIHTSSLPFRTNTSINKAVSQEKDPLSETEEDKTSASPDTTPVTHASAASNQPSHPIGEGIPSPPAAHTVKSHQQSFLEDEGPSVGAATCGASSFSQRSQLTALHSLLDERNLSCSSIPLTSVGSDVDLYGPSLNDFQSTIHAPSNEKVDEAEDNIHRAPDSISRKEVEFCQWTETVTTTSALSRKVETIQQTEAVYGDSRCGLNGSITREEEIFHKTEEVSPDSRTVADMEFILQLEVVTATSGVATNLAIQQHAEEVPSIPTVAEKKFIQQLEMVSATSVATTTSEIQQHTEAVPPPPTSAANVEFLQCIDMFSLSSTSTMNAAETTHKVASTSAAEDNVSEAVDAETTTDITIPVADLVTESMRRNEDADKSSSFHLLISSESIPSHPMVQREVMIPADTTLQSAFTENTCGFNLKAEKTYDGNAPSSVEPLQRKQIKAEHPISAPSSAQPPIPDNSHKSPPGCPDSHLHNPLQSSPPKMLHEDPPVSAKPLQPNKLPAEAPTVTRSSSQRPIPDNSRKSLPGCPNPHLHDPLQSSPPKMLREDPPHSDSPPSHPAQPGISSDPFSMFSLSSDVSLQGCRSNRRRKRRSIRLAPSFSEEACPVPSSEAAGTCDRQQMTEQPMLQTQTTSVDRHFGGLSSNLQPVTEPSSTEQGDIAGDNEGKFLGTACSEPDGPISKSTFVEREVETDRERLRGEACSRPTGSPAHTQLSADPSATKQSSACDDNAGDDIHQFLNDEDMWRFPCLDGLTGSIQNAESATPTTRVPITGGAPTSSDGGLYRPPSQLSLGKAASNMSADELENDLINTLMHQASCASSAEQQLSLMQDVMDLSFQKSSLSQEKFGAFEIDKGEITSGVYTASSPHGPSPTEEVTESMATLQKQLSTISSSSSASSGGTKVTVMIDETSHISIKMGRDKTIRDLALGISAQVPDYITTFTLRTDDGLSLTDSNPIGNQELSLVVIHDPAIYTWLWRVRRGSGDLEYP